VGERQENAVGRDVPNGAVRSTLSALRPRLIVT
jgi:hypothetical protein